MSSQVEHRADQRIEASSPPPKFIRVSDVAQKAHHKQVRLIRRPDNKWVKIGNAVIVGAAGGGIIGSMFGPVGIGIGAIAGGAFAGIFESKEQKNSSH